MRAAAIIPIDGSGTGLSRVLAALPHGHLESVVVVGGSGEDLAEAIRRHGATFVGAPRPGLGRACLAGLAHLASAPPDVVVFLRGDGSDDAEELPAVLSPLLSPGVDLVMGSRSRGQPDPGAYPALVRLGHWIATGLILLLYGYRYTDLGPFRAVRWNALPRLQPTDPDYGWLAEMQVNAARARVPSVEVPVSSHPAPHGSAGAAFARSLLAGVKVLLTIVRPRGVARGRSPDATANRRAA